MWDGFAEENGINDEEIITLLQVRSGIKPKNIDYDTCQLCEVDNSFKKLSSHFLTCAKTQKRRTIISHRIKDLILEQLLATGLCADKEVVVSETNITKDKASTLTKKIADLCVYIQNDGVDHVHFIEIKVIDPLSWTYIKSDPSQFKALTHTIDESNKTYKPFMEQYAKDKINDPNKQKVYLWHLAFENTGGYQPELFNFFEEMIKYIPSDRAEHCKGKRWIKATLDKIYIKLIKNLNHTKSLYMNLLTQFNSKFYISDLGFNPSLLDAA